DLRKPPLVSPDSSDGSWQSLAEVSDALQSRAMGRVAAEAARQGIDLRNLKDISKEQEEQLRAKLSAELQLARTQAPPAYTALQDALHAYEDNKPEEFHKAAAAYWAKADVPADDASKANYEVFFNRFAPFYQCSLLY